MPATDYRESLSTLVPIALASRFYPRDAMHASAGTSNGPVSVSVSVSVYHKSVFSRNEWTE